MKHKSLILTAALGLFIYSCQNNKTQEGGSDITISPESGTSYKAGDAVNVKVNYPASVKPDSVT